MDRVDVLGNEMAVDQAARPRKKQRKQRPCYSCTECRRLKMRCDRTAPCSNCVRRDRVQFCREPTTSTTSSREDQSLSLVQGQNDWHLQSSKPNGNNVQGVPPTQQSSEYSQPQQGPQRHNERTTQRPPGPKNDGSQLAASTGAIGQIAAQRPGPNGSTSVFPGTRIDMHNATDGASASSNSAMQPIDDFAQTGSHGTLMLDKAGRSKYLGPTAGSEWLKDYETQDVSDSASNTRAPSPEIPSLPFQPTLPASITAASTFPFSTGAPHISTRHLLSHLPPRDEAWALVEAYYRYCAWHHDVAPKAQFEKTFERVYSLANKGSRSSAVNAQELALVFVIMAQGTMYNIEMATFDPSADEWLRLSELALVKGNFLSNHVIAGLQTIHLMAHMHLESDKGRRGDSAWPLWGLVMRLVQAMGMHRDGTRWNLPQDVIEERRKVFWECNAADIFQAHCFSRPCAINPEHCDTTFPAEPLNLSGEKSYFILRFELSQLSSEILTMAMKVHKPPYSHVTDLDLRLCEFERNLPFSIRCRAALLSMPSRYPQVKAAIEASPEPSRSAMTNSFRQTNLALNVSETIINLHRPYYAKALYDEIEDRVKSVYAPSFLAVIERCAIILAIVSDIHARFPAVSIRQWNFWFHVYNSALCLGTLVLRDPSNAMATFALEQIDIAVSLFTSLTQHGADTPRYHRNLEWLQKLHARASAKISKAGTIQKSGPPQRGATASDHHIANSSEESEDATEDVELLGWRTRLIERAGQGRPTISTIPLPPTPAGSQVTNISNPLLPADPIGDQQQSGGVSAANIPAGSMSFATPDPTDVLLHDFWDPMLLQDIFGAPVNQTNLYGINGSAWWEDPMTATDTSQMRN